MFEAREIQVKLSRVINFPEIGESDTVVLKEPSGAFSSQGFETSKQKQDAFYRQTRICSYIFKDGVKHRLSEKVNIFACLPIVDAELLTETFIAFANKLPEKKEKKEDNSNDFSYQENNSDNFSYGDADPK